MKFLNTGIQLYRNEQSVIYHFQLKLTVVFVWERWCFL